MKKWTVMLIPHDRGNTRTLNLHSFHVWFVALALVLLSFTASFFYARHHVLQEELVCLEHVNGELAAECAQKAAEPVATNTFDARDRLEIERRIRAEYEASLSAIAAELGDLRDLEAQARTLTGLGPKASTVAHHARASEGGKGGGSVGLSDIAYDQAEAMANPAHVIYGLSDPSADLIIQEINLRTQSLQTLVSDLEEQAEQLRHLPSIWPLAYHRGTITSGFGYRRDPFTYRICHHEGTDISARTGTDVIASADGVVTFAGRDGSYGKVVRVSHGNGLVTCYAHLSKILVDVGEQVSRRDVIGEVGSTGRSTGPHLHYEVRSHGKPVNPAKYLGD